MKRAILSNIEAERARHGMTREEVGQAIGVSQASYLSYITGGRPIRSDKLLMLADMWNCTTDYLLGREAKNGGEANGKADDQR